MLETYVGTPVYMAPEVISAAENSKSAVGTLEPSASFYLSLYVDGEEAPDSLRLGAALAEPGAEQETEVVDWNVVQVVECVNVQCAGGGGAHLAHHRLFLSYRVRITLHWGGWRVPQTDQILGKVRDLIPLASHHLDIPRLHDTRVWSTLSQHLPEWLYPGEKDVENNPEQPTV